MTVDDAVWVDSGRMSGAVAVDCPCSNASGGWRMAEGDRRGNR